jgi:carboxyl-terminal processing protease
MKKIKQVTIIVLLLTVFTVSMGYKSDFFEVAKQIEIYTTLFKELNMYYIDETNPAELTDIAIDKMLNNLDPYTKFYDEQGVEKARINAAGEYGGIGAAIKIVNDKLIVIEPYQNAPADKAGIKAGDEIIKINDVLIEETQAEDAALLLNGTPNSKFTLQFKRQGKILTTELTRETIDVDPVPYYQMLDDEVGYISFIKFNSKASSRVKDAFEDLKTQGMTKLILDIRGNLGGLLNEAVEITNFFVPKDEVVVTTKAKVKKWSDVYKTKREPIDMEIPIVVLIDHFSASASEIVAGSLQDLDRAVIVGERSFGKGLVQRYRKLTYGTQLKNGRTVYDGGGIEPDIKLKKEEKTNATKALLKSDAIFNYATKYYYNNPEVTSSKEYIFTDNDYQQFLDYLKLDDDVFKTETELQFTQALITSETEGYKSRIEQEYQNLADKIKVERINDLSNNKSEINEAITNEIVRRYYYKKGEYIHKVHHDKSIIEAVKVLKNENKYQNILK